MASDATNASDTLANRASCTSNYSNVIARMKWEADELAGASIVPASKVAHDEVATIVVNANMKPTEVVTTDEVSADVGSADVVAAGDEAATTIGPH